MRHFRACVDLRYLIGGPSSPTSITGEDVMTAVWTYEDVITAAPLNDKETNRNSMSQFYFLLDFNINRHICAIPRIILVGFYST